MSSRKGTPDGCRKDEGFWGGVTADGAGRWICGTLSRKTWISGGWGVSGVVEVRDLVTRRTHPRGSVPWV